MHNFPTAENHPILCGVFFRENNGKSFLSFWIQEAEMIIIVKVKQKLLQKVGNGQARSLRSRRRFAGCSAAGDKSPR